MKKSYLVALILSVSAVGSFAQGTAETAGARRVAERDAAYAKDHPTLVHERNALRKQIGKHHRKARHHRRVKHKAVR